MTTAPPTPPAEDEIDIAEHFRKGVESAPIGIICVDGTKGRYVFVNECFARMIGRQRDDVMRSDPFQIAFEATHPDDRLKSRHAIESIAQGVTDDFSYEKRLVRSDGSQLWISARLSGRRDAQGRLTFLTFYFTDIQAQRAAEEARLQLRQAQKLEALGRLAGGIAHDFNNRLLIIMGHTELLKNGLPPQSPLRERTELVLGSAQRAGELARQLLAYGRRHALKPQAFDLNAVVDNMERLLERLLGRDIMLSTALNAGHAIRADPGQIEQVIINLALNARDAMPEGGQLSLETRDVSLADSQDELPPPGDYVALVVSDSGVGIPEELLPRIFEPFFTTKEEGRGTGLGHATVEDIVRQSGGSLRVQSTPGAGSTFTIYLPRASQPLAALQAAAQAEQAPQTPGFETVLVCDREPGVRELIVNVLKLRGYSVLQAANAAAALALASRPGPLHLLVIEPTLPEPGARELIAQLRAHHPQLQVLYISSYAEQGGPPDAPDARTHHLAKPFLPSDLTRSVCAILERR
jgi:PAS domain S-box-containing protein